VRSTTLIAAVVASLLLALATPAPAAEPGATHIVQVRGGVSLAQAAGIVRSAHGRVAGTLPIIHGLAVRLPRGAGARLARDPRIEAVTVNARVLGQDMAIEVDDPAPEPEPEATREPEATTEPAPLDELDESLIATAYPASVHAPRAWNTATGAGVGIAVIDTGIAGDLPDLRAADGTSRVVASVVTNPDGTTAEDGYGHGTHVAGIIAGDSRRRGAGDPLAGRYMGIAPDAHLIAIKASDDAGRSTILDAIYGLQFAVDHHDEYDIRVVNLSLSSTVPGSYRTDPLDAAVEAAYFHGLLVVAAAGNRGSAEDATDYAPGNDPFALSVGGVDDQGTHARGDDVFAEWSSRGETQDGFAKPDIAAPGAHIVSTLAPGSLFADMCPSCIVDGDYIRLGGTSMAAPVVSGVAALVFQAHPDWTAAQVKATLIETARNLDGGVDEVAANSAVSAAGPAPSADAEIPPNDLVDTATGEIDYARSSWGRSSWGNAPEGLAAGWARSSWGCDCAAGEVGTLESTRSSWGTATWLGDWRR
jgi:serine protease AprX